MDVAFPPVVERLPLHRAHLEAACMAASDQDGIVGMVIGGSFASGEADEYSDLDLQLVVEDTKLQQVLGQLRDVADAAGLVVAAFTAEHVGLPNMLIVLYEDLIHADFEPVPLSRLQERDAGLSAFVLWERGGAVSTQLPTDAAPEDLRREMAWFEDRMWTWSWYIQTKALRGELYESVDGLQYVRDKVLFRLLSLHRGEHASGSRRAEQRLGSWADRFAATVPTLSQQSALAALRGTMQLYQDLADPLLEKHGVPRADKARGVVLEALDSGLSWSPPTPKS
jgi:predicted nucleotidyltransferase